MRDIMSGLAPVPVLHPKGAVIDNTAYVGVVVNHKDHEGAVYLIHSGANTDANATFAALLEESDTGAFGGEENAVADEDLVGTEALAGFTAANDDNKVKMLGYQGSKLYTRLTVTPAGNDVGNHFFSAICVRGLPTRQPTPNPPA